MKKRIPILLIVILGLTALVYWRVKSNAFAYAGTVEATEVDVSVQVASSIASLAVDEGASVTLGQTLAVLDGRDYKLNQGLVTDDYNRGVKLLKSGSMPEEAFNHLKTQKELADLRVQWCNITSPIRGRVLTKYHEAGEWVPVGAKLFTLADLSRVWCLFYVAEPVLVKISIGQKVKGTLPNTNGKTFEGTITHINDQSEFTPKNVQTRQERTRLVYGVKVTFDNPDGLLKPGMTLETDLPKE